VSTLDAHLVDLLSTVSTELPEVSTKYMFGCQAFFANRAIYALVWDGRLCVKLPEPALLEQVLSMDGADRWSPMPNGKGMGHWVMLPEELHDDLDALTPWVERAHRLAMMAPPKKEKAKAPSKAKAAPKAKPARTTRRR
jgi:TfoX/Sxy family transcriptional regulator of competence genes